MRPIELLKGATVIIAISSALSLVSPPQPADAWPWKQQKKTSAQINKISNDCWKTAQRQGQEDARRFANDKNARGVAWGQCARSDNPTKCFQGYETGETQTSSRFNICLRPHGI